MNPHHNDPVRTTRGLLFDWGDTLMRNFGEYAGIMADWPRVEALPGAAEALAALQPTWRLAVATNAAGSNQADIWRALERVGLHGFFEQVYCFRAIGYQKPSAEFFQHVLADLGLAPGQVGMVGDDLDVDVLGANRWGIRAVWLNERTAAVSHGPLHRTIHAFPELAAALADLFERA